MADYEDVDEVMIETELETPTLSKKREKQPSV